MKHHASLIKLPYPVNKDQPIIEFVIHKHYIITTNIQDTINIAFIIVNASYCFG